MSVAAALASTAVDRRPDLQRARSAWPISSTASSTRTRAAGLDGELVIVDDNSPDGTGALADELAQRAIGSPCVHRAGKLGLGTAVIEGFAAAAAPIVGVIDADMSHPPALLPRMLAVMQRDAADVVDRQPLHPRRRHAQLADRPAA